MYDDPSVAIFSLELNGIFLLVKKVLNYYDECEIISIMPHPILNSFIQLIRYPVYIHFLPYINTLLQ